jgi:hypothetical protein
MSAQSVNLRATLLRIVIGGIVAYGCLTAFVVSDQLANLPMVSRGRMDAHRHRRRLRAVLVTCCVNDGDSGHLASFVHWLDTPTDWLGWHKLLEVIPASIGLFALSMLGNFAFIYGSDRIREQRQTQTNSPPEGNPPMSENPRPPFPPFDAASAAAKVRLAEDAWNSRDPQRVSLAYTPDSVWRNRSEFLVGRAAIVEFLVRKWNRELDYRLIVPDRPADQQRPIVEPARIDAEHHRRQRLDDPDAAEQLQLNRVLRRHEQMNTSAPSLTISDTHFAICASCFVGRVLVDELAVDVAGV